MTQPTFPSPTTHTVKFTIKRDGGISYDIWMEPGQWISLRPDESLEVPEPPKLDEPLAVTLLNDHERRIKFLETQLTAILRRLASGSGVVASAIADVTSTPGTP